MTAAFTVAVAGSGPYEDGARLYARYYDFALPLLLIVGAASSRLAHPSRRRSVAIALFVGALAVWAATTGMKDYAIHVIDAPELRGILTNSRVRWGAALLGVASLVVWCVRPRIAPALFVFVCMPICVVAGSRKASAELRALRSQPEVHDRAGLFARHLLSRDQAAKLRVIGDDHAGLYRALFHVDTASATFLLVDRDAAVGAMPDLDADTWLLIVGHHPLLLPESSRIAGDGFVLVRPRQAGPAVPSP